MSFAQQTFSFFRRIAVTGLVTLFASVLFVVSAAPAEATTSGWWTGNPPLTQSFGCTSFGAEPIESWRGCPASLPRFHDGIDVGMSGGTPLYAAVPVTVISIGGKETGFGSYYPRLRLPDGRDVLLGHVQPPVVVTAGQHVPAGSIVGYAGSQGNSTGCHLHFEVRPGGGAWGSSVDPAAYLRPGGAQFANGAFVRAADTGRIYRIVGGAPLWLNTCVEGCPGLINTTQSVIDGLAQVPTDGSFVRAVETGRLYRIVGGAPLWLNTCVEGCPGMVNVNQWTIDTFNHLRANPAGGSFVRAVETGRVYRIVGGAPLWLNTCVDGCPGLVNVNQWTVDTLDHLSAYPANGTLLHAVETGRVYQVTDGSPKWLSQCPPQGCVAMINVDQWTIDVRDHLRP